MDIVMILGTLPGLVLHSIGTHGVEGFAGSAIQIAHLMSLATTDDAAPMKKMWIQRLDG